MALRPKFDIESMFAERKAAGKYVKICAPMVRYSQLAFRRLVRRHGVDIAYTPMIVSDSFVKSARAREADFTTCSHDTPVVAQFAACNTSDFTKASSLIAPYVDAVDLNCGCPQKWAMQDGIGAHLISKPELIADMVQSARRNLNIPVSIKIRLRETTKDTVELCRRAEQMGVAWLAVHGRTPKERRCPVHFEEILAVKDALSVPVIANGDIFSLNDANQVVQRTRVDGVMSARGLLANPALFEGAPLTPKNVVEEVC